MILSLLMSIFKCIFVSCIILFSSSCSKQNTELEPKISYTAPSYVLEKLPSPAPSLSQMEVETDWGKELLYAQNFAKEQDYFRAITSYKKALFLDKYEHIPKNRLAQIQYGVLLSYYLANKYDSVCEAFEKMNLRHLNEDFYAYKDLLIILYDSYMKRQDRSRAQKAFSLIDQKSPQDAAKLALYTQINAAQFPTLQDRYKKNADVNKFLNSFNEHKKSPTSAGLLNALLPGAGYLYVGQKQTALTSFLLNALFIAASYQFFHKGQLAAGVITLGFETGWYIGGIHGASIAAKQYNDTLYNRLAQDMLSNKKLFPVLMLEYGF